MKTKTELMALVVAGHCRECFEHSEEGIFDITAMRERAPQLGFITQVALADIVPHIIHTRVIEQARVAALPLQSWVDDPGIFIEYEQNGERSHLMVDGHHRAIRRHLEGFKHMRFWIIREALACRPAPGWAKAKHMDWGDDIVDGKIIRRNPWPHGK